MTLEELASQFDARQTSSGYMAHCPTHKDSTASLSIGINGDKILMKCFAGCTIEGILEAKNLTKRDLFVNGSSHLNGSSRSPIAATYLYRDQDSVVRYRKQRTVDKKFWFERPDGHGGWIAKKEQNGGKPVMESVERLLYRLPELRDYAAGAAETCLVYVVEGEKDADRLWKLRLPATTNDGGASQDTQKTKWTDALTQQLKLASVTTVVCLPDHDDAGRAHMRAVARSCTAAGIEVRIVDLPGLPEKGDVSDYFDAGHTVSELVALVDATKVYVPETPVEDTPPPAVPAPYTFEHAFPSGHFVTRWIEHFRQQSDAALEYHEAAALVTLALATPSLTARISGSAGGLRTNLYVLLIGDPGRSRKSTAKNYAVSTIKRTLPDALLPEQMTQEALVESLTRCQDGSALWAIDEFTDMLSKMVTANYLAGMRGTLLEMYETTDYTYRRVSKKPRKKKDDDGESEREEDAFHVSNVTLSLLGCATPTIFQKLDNTSVGSGLLTRFAIVMPEVKPPRLPQYALTEDPIPNALVQWLHDVSVRTAKLKVGFAPGVLARLDAEIDQPLDESADRGQMTVRMGVMARKVAMLSAAGRVPDFALESPYLVVTMDDAEAAIRVVTRWIGYARVFEQRTDESAFEVTVQKCVALIKGRTLQRRDIARRVHVQAKDLVEIEKTLVQRDQIEVDERKSTGRPSIWWRWVG